MSSKPLEIFIKYAWASLLGSMIVNSVMPSTQDKVREALIQKYDTPADRDEIFGADVGIFVDKEGHHQFYLLSDPTQKPSIDQLIQALAADKGVNATGTHVSGSVVSPEKSSN